MNTQSNTGQQMPDQQKKPYAEPELRREARLPVVTAGSFDLIIPNP